MATTIGAMDQVMELQPAGRATAVHATAASVAAPHEAHDARRDILIRPLRLIAVDRSDVLSIAQRAVDRGRVDRDPRTRAVLPALAAALAYRDRDLEFRAAGGLGPRRTIEHRAAQRGDEPIVRQVGAVLVVEHGAGLPQQ